MGVGLSLGAGLIVGLIIIGPLRRLLTASPGLRRLNYRGHELATAGGLVIVIVVLLTEAGWVLGRAAVGHPLPTTPTRLGGVLVVVGFALLGFVDDVLGEATGAGGDRGFKGHVRALLRGRVTTGGLKLIGGPLVALPAVALAGGARVELLVLDALVVALCANTVNLFDRRPGRAVKVAVIGFGVLTLAIGLPVALAIPAAAMGAALAFIPSDLSEKAMLGDTGANALGAVIGLGLVQTVPPFARLWVAAALLITNVASERVSFSRLIDAVPPLRFVDRLGRVVSNE